MKKLHATFLKKITVLLVTFALSLQCVPVWDVLADTAEKKDMPDGIDTSLRSGAMDCTYTSQWVPMYPSGQPDSGTWTEWDSTHYAEISPQGYRDIGALHMKSAELKNTAVTILAGMISGQTYTLGMWVKGTTNNANRVLAMYGNGNGVIIGKPEHSPNNAVAAELLTEEWSYVEFTFTAQMSQLNLVAADWGQSDIYIDNITLKNRNGRDILSGNGDFYHSAVPEPVYEPMTINSQRVCSAYNCRYTDCWVPMYPTGEPAGTWSQWDNTHFARIVADGYLDTGALFLQSANGKNTAVATKTAMIPGETYTLGMWVKGTTNNPNKVLALYGNGDGVLVGKPAYSPDGVVGTGQITNQWTYTEITFTASSNQLNLMAVDWGSSGVYVDNLTLKDKNGEDILDGLGNFCVLKSTAVEDGNFDFELTATGVPFAWTHKAVLADSTAEIYTENVYSGNHSLRVFRKNGQLDCSFMYNQSRIPVTAGDRIEFVAHISSRNSISGKFNMFILGYDEEGTVQTDACHGQERITNAGGSWSQWDTYELVYTIPENVKFIQLGMSIGGAQADVLVDDIVYFNYTENGNLVYNEDFAEPSRITGLPGGWTGENAAVQNEILNVSGYAETTLYMLRTGYSYRLDVVTKGEAASSGKIILEAVNWDGTSAGQPVALNMAGSREYAEQFTAVSGVCYSLKVEGNISLENISLFELAQGKVYSDTYEKPENLPGKEAPTTTSSVETVGGKTYMLVNGEPVVPVWYARPENPDLFEAHTVAEFAKAGVDTVVSYVFLNNLYGDVWTKDGFVPAAIDDMMLSTLAGNPDAKLIIALDFNAPQWWCQENPGELVALANSQPERTNASFASEKWKQESGEIMLQVVDYLMSRSYANQIIGFKVTGGYTLEWNWWAMSGAYNDVGDFSQCGIAAFRQWLTEKYGTDAALQKAYSNNTVTLKNVMPPSAELRSDHYLDTVITVQDHPEMMDYELFMAQLKADTIDYFAGLIKNAIDDRLIVGTYGGYFYMGGGYEFSSAVANAYFQPLLQSENIDFIKSPWRYGQREIGDSAEFMGPVDSLDLYGKLWIVEEDSRLNLQTSADKQDDRASVGWTRNYQQSVEQLKRNFSYVLSKGMGISFYNLVWNFTDDPQYYSVIAQMTEEMKKSLCLISESTADIAVFVDGQSQMLIPYENGTDNSVLHLSILKEQLAELGHTGATYDTYLLDDLKDGLVPEYKINIFLATTLITPEEREAIARELQKNGNILVWIFTDGISDGSKTDLALMQELTGMKLSLISTNRLHNATAKISNNTHWLTSGMELGQYYGVIHYDKLSPVIAVDDSSAVTLAKHTSYANRTAMAVKDMGDWTSVYSAVPNLPQALIRNMLIEVGGHIYTDSPSDVIYANTDYVALHTLFAGERTVRLPEKATVQDAFSGEILARDTDTFTVNISGKETRLFRLIQSDTVLAELDASRKTDAYTAPSDQWTPMYPTGTPGGTWPQWDTQHYGRIVAEGYQNPGALNLKSYYYQNTGVALDVGMTPGQKYTLGLWAKGTSDAGRVLALYANGDPCIIATGKELAETWQYYELTFTAGIRQLNLMVTDWGNTNIFMDNITLKDAAGNDLLAGFGDFCQEKTDDSHNWLEATCTTPRMCFACQHTEGEALGHSYGQWETVRPATLTTDGLRECVCENCHDTVTETIPCLAGNVESWGLTLGSDLTVRFAMQIHPDIVQTALVEITVADETYIHVAKDGAWDSQTGCYLFSVSVAAAQMTDDITVRIISGEDVSVSKTYSVATYANRVLSDSTMEAYRSLVKAMLQYGGAAQRYFDYHTERCADADVGVSEGQDVPESWEPEMMVSGKSDELKFYGASLVFEEKTALRMYFRPDGQTHTFLWNHQMLTAVEEGEYLYVEISDINPQDLDEIYTVTIDGEMTASYSPMNYIVRMNQKGSQKLNPLLQALYGYYLAAENMR